MKVTTKNEKILGHKTEALILGLFEKQKITGDLKNIDDAFVVKVIRDMGVTNNKIYMLSDMLNAKYSQTTWTKFKKKYHTDLL